MVKNKAEEAQDEYEDYSVSPTNKDKSHLDPNCRGKHVKEGDSGTHCPDCGSWIREEFGD